MKRALTSFAVFLLLAGPIDAQQGEKLTNAELKEIASGTEGILFAGGYSISHGTSYHKSWFSEGVRKGTRKMYWTNGPQHQVWQGDWRVHGDAICEKNENEVSEVCSEWRRNGDRIETWSRGVKTGYFYVLPKASSQ